MKKVTVGTYRKDMPGDGTFTEQIRTVVRLSIDAQPKRQENHVRRSMIWTGTCVLLCAMMGAHSQEKVRKAEDGTIVWGKVVDGLQLGIAPPDPTKKAAKPLFDGNTMRGRVCLRNAGKKPVRLLASVHTCLAFSTGANSLLASKLILQVPKGGNALVVNYTGWNHLFLLDKRRPKSEEAQDTLKRTSGKTDIQLTPENAKRVSIVLAPGDTRVTRIQFTPGKNKKSAWKLEEPAALPAGTYRMTAVLTVDHELSEWKGELKSSPLSFEIPKPLEE